MKGLSCLTPYWGKISMQHVLQTHSWPKLTLSRAGSVSQGTLLQVVLVQLIELSKVHQGLPAPAQRQIQADVGRIGCV